MPTDPLHERARELLARTEYLTQPTVGYDHKLHWHPGRYDRERGSQGGLSPGVMGGYYTRVLTGTYTLDDIKALLDRHKEGGIMPRYSWTQPCCERCWIARNTSEQGIRVPTRVVDSEVEICSFCGHDTIFGVFVRADPATVSFPAVKGDE